MIKSLSQFFLLLLALCISSTTCSADYKMSLEDKFLQQATWAMYIDAQEIQHYLDYRESTLHPLTRVRISYRDYREMNGLKQEKSRPYEFLWYCGNAPVGQDRFIQPSFDSQHTGLVVLGPIRSNGFEHSAVMTNALLRLLIDLQFRNGNVSNVMVAEENYSQIASCLNHYNFYTATKPGEGKQMSIHLSSTGSAREEYFYLGK